MKQRLVGAAVLVALAVIFLPMLVQGPAPDSGVSNVPLTMPEPPRGDYETRDLPLVGPGETPAGGAVGMNATPASPAIAPPAAASAPTTASTSTPASTPVPLAEAAGPPVAKALPANDAALPAATAGGDYAVSFGAYASTAAADRMVASLRASQLPGYREATTSNGKPAWRVRIGPYATRAEAEAARLRAAHVRDDVGASVVVLDAAGDTAVVKPTAAVTPPPAKPAPVAAPVTPPPPAAASPSAAATGFAVQLAAYSKPADAEALRDRVRAAGFSAFTETVGTDKGTLTRVRVGPVVSRSDAEALKAQVKAKLGVDGIVRPHP